MFTVLLYSFFGNIKIFILAFFVAIIQFLILSAIVSALRNAPELRSLNTGQETYIKQSAHQAGTLDCTVANGKTHKCLYGDLTSATASSSTPER